MAGERTRYYQQRPRRVPPEFCQDELLEECSLLATLLLYRLISLADDQGRLPGHPKHVRATCFPMRSEVSEAKVAKALNELVRAGFLIRYDVAGRAYLQIDRWFDLQGKWANRRVYPSRYPAPPGWEDYQNVEVEDDEVRAPRAQSARDVRPPIPLPSSSTFTVPVAGLREGAARRGSPERVSDLLERAKRGLLSDDEALELGTAIATDEQARERSPR